MKVRKKHGTEMKDVLIMHLIAKPHTNGSSCFTGVVTTTGNRSKLDLAVLNFVQSYNSMNDIDLQGNKPLSVLRYAAYNFIELFASSGHVGPGAKIVSARNERYICGSRAKYTNISGMHSTRLHIKR